MYPLKLTAQATQPGMSFSETYINFGTVVCGQCRIVTIRLTNPRPVRCVCVCVYVCVCVCVCSCVCVCVCNVCACVCVFVCGRTGVAE